MPWPKHKAIRLTTLNIAASKVKHVYACARARAVIDSHVLQIDTHCAHYSKVAVNNLRVMLEEYSTSYGRRSCRCVRHRQNRPITQEDHCHMAEQNATGWVITGMSKKREALANPLLIMLPKMDKLPHWGTPVDKSALRSTLPRQTGGKTRRRESLWLHQILRNSKILMVSG